MHFEEAPHIFQEYPQCLIHAVSCQGLAHDILSKKIKRAYPEYFRDYTRLCLRKKLQPGRAYVYALNVLFGTQYIVTLTYKDKWQEAPSRQHLSQALSEFFAHKLNLDCVAFPKISEIPKEWLEEEFNKYTAGNEQLKVEFFTP